MSIQPTQDELRASITSVANRYAVPPVPDLSRNASPTARGPFRRSLLPFVAAAAVLAVLLGLPMVLSTRNAPRHSPSAGAPNSSAASPDASPSPSAVPGVRSSINSQAKLKAYLADGGGQMALPEKLPRSYEWLGPLDISGSNEAVDTRSSQFATDPIDEGARVTVCTSTRPLIACPRGEAFLTRQLSTAKLALAFYGTTDQITRAKAVWADVDFTTAGAVEWLP